MESREHTKTTSKSLHRTLSPCRKEKNFRNLSNPAQPEKNRKKERSEDLNGLLDCKACAQQNTLTLVSERQALLKLPWITDSNKTTEADSCQ